MVDENHNCSIVAGSDKVTSAAGKFLTSARNITHGFEVTFTMAKAANNRSGGALRVKDQFRV
ncbi:MAG: hypothetical protein VYB63_06885 [Chloroflexota bacterium]|nr:hypothetical protein [Chloroflexota bacterium]